MIVPPRHPAACAAAALAVVVWFSFGPVRAGHAQSAQGLGSAATATDPAYFNQYHGQPRDTVSPAAYDGFKQFALNCARCHGDFGVGSSFAPALVVSLSDTGRFKTGERATKELFVATVCGGRPDKGMPAWCALGLEMDKIQAMYAYLSGRAAGTIGAGRPAVRRAPESGSKM
jgi:mono/diheme cytochrome c family protein